MTVVYLSDNQIRVITGSKGKITHQAYSSQVDSCIANGIVTDEALFCEKITQFFERNGIPKKEIILVLRSRQLITRVMTVPIKNEAGTYEYIANEFSDAERVEHPVYAYGVLKTNKKTKLRQIFAILADRAYIETFVSLFQRCGIKVTAMEHAVLCAIRALSGNVQLQNKTAVVQIMEERDFTNLLFVNGEYTYSNENRMFSERSTPQMGVEVARAVSSLIQFTQAQRISGEIKTVLFAQFSKEDQRFSGEAIRELCPGVVGETLDFQRVTVPQGEGAAANLFFPAGALFEQDKSASLLQNFGRKLRVQTLDKDLKRLLRISAVVISVTLVVMVAAFIARAQLQNKLDALNVFINAESTQEGEKSYKKLEKKKKNYEAQLDAITATNEDLQTYPLPNTGVNERLEACAEGLVEIEVLQYSSTTGELQIACRAKNVDRISQFVALVEKKSAFKVQDYSGYVYNEETKDWSVNILICLNSEAGR